MLILTYFKDSIFRALYGTSLKKKHGHCKEIVIYIIQLLEVLEVSLSVSKDIPFEKVDGRNAQLELGVTGASEPVLLPLEWIQRVGTYILSKSS